MPHASKKDFEVAFTGLDFPTSKAAVVNRARDNGGLDREVKEIIVKLPDRTYASLEELQEAVRAAYLAEGVAEDAVPL